MMARAVSAALLLMWRGQKKRASTLPSDAPDFHEVVVTSPLPVKGKTLVLVTFDERLGALELSCLVLGLLGVERVVGCTAASRFRGRGRDCLPFSPF